MRGGDPRGHAALQRLHAWAQTLDTAASARMQALLRPRDPDAQPHARFRRVAQPVMDLPAWLAAHLRERDGSPLHDSAVEQAIEASLCGYLYVALLDARGDAIALEVALLAQRLFVRHVTLLERVGAGAALWQLFERCWQDHATACLARRAALRATDAGDDVELAASVQRARPLLLPGAALLDRAGREAELPLLLGVIEHSTRAAQLFDDLVDATGDHAAGHATTVVRRLGAPAHAAQLQRELFLAGGADRVLGETLAELDAARSCARAAEWSAIDDGLAHEQARVRDFQHQLAAALAGEIFGAPRREGETKPWI